MLHTSVAKVNRLVIPEQKFGLGSLITADRRFIRFVHRIRREFSGSKTSRRKIYVSRTRFSIGSGGILGESVIEVNLAAQGYHIVYPETLSLVQQLELYSLADTLIFSEGSAIHGYALVGHKSQKMGILCRRGWPGLFVRHVESFRGKAPVRFNAIKGYYLPVRNPVPGARAAALLDYDEIRSQFLRSGFINEGAPWLYPAEHAISEEIENFRTLHGGDVEWEAVKPRQSN